MKKVILLLFFFLKIAFTYATDADSLRYDLIHQLQERKLMFEEYSSSLAKHSGFFGNRSKGDLKDSQEALRKIVAADNKIIEILNRTLQFKNFEKSNLSYDASENEERINALKVLNDTLTHQNENFISQNKLLSADVKRHNIYFVFIFLVAAGGLWWWWKRRI